jgi:DNA-binding NtrC family response regulator
MTPTHPRPDSPSDSRDVEAVELVGRSPAVRRLVELLRRAAALKTGVLLVAERGAEVEPVARCLHRMSRHAAAPVVVVSCANHDPADLERRLLGTSPDGVPTDLEWVSGRSDVAEARGGMVFLQDVTELPAGLQARLARLARDGQVRLDGVATAVNVRLVASAPPTIEGDAREHRFRPELYGRLATSRIDLPPLRDRPEDIPAVAIRVLAEACVDRGEPPRTFTQATLALLAALNWPGNLAELRRVVARVVGESGERVIQIEHVLPALRLDRPQPAFAPSGNLREARERFERDYVAAVLEHHGWRVAEAAQTLGIQRPNLYRKARQLGIPLARLSHNGD